MKSSRFTLSYFLLSILVTACAPNGVGSSFLTGSAGFQTDSTVTQDADLEGNALSSDVGVSTTHDDTSITNDSVPDAPDSMSGPETESHVPVDGGENLVPTSSIPVSYLTSDVLAYNTDANNNVPITGNSDATTVAVATDREAFVQNSTDQNQSLASSFTSFFFSSAHAEGENYSLCDEPGITCCPVVDGKITDGAGREACFVPLADTSVSQIYIAGLDENAELTSQVVEEKINGNLLYIADGALQIDVIDGVVSTLKQGALVSMGKNSAGKLQTQGDHNSDYVATTVTGSKIAFDESEKIGLLDATNGIHLHTETSGVVDANHTTFTANTSSLGFSVSRYTALKSARNLDGKMYTGVAVTRDANTFSDTNGYPNLGYIFKVTTEEADESASEDSSFSAFDNYTNSQTSASASNFELIYTGDVDAAGNKLTMKSLISFDINSAGFACAIYDDAQSEVRVRCGDRDNRGMGTRFGGRVALQGSGKHRFHDLVFVNDTKLFLLDESQDKIWKLSVNSSLQTVSYKLNDGIAIDSPIAISMDENKSFAFVLSRDESVSIVDLSSMAVTQKIVLKDLIQDKELTHKPVTIKYYDSQILVGNSRTKSVLVIPWSSSSKSTKPSRESTELPVFTEDNRALPVLTKDNDDSKFKPDAQPNKTRLNDTPTQKSGSSEKKKETSD